MLFNCSKYLLHLLKALTLSTSWFLFYKLFYSLKCFLSSMCLSKAPIKIIVRQLTYNMGPLKLSQGREDIEIHGRERW